MFCDITKTKWFCHENIEQERKKKKTYRVLKQSEANILTNTEQNKKLRKQLQLQLRLKLKYLKFFKNKNKRIDTTLYTN